MFYIFFNLFNCSLCSIHIQIKNKTKILPQLLTTLEFM
uniref:Uncharacterized protein n=1 Tax=Rhizophora mucronata TaxID=61149 RepID=A0A2P2PXD1_RHIMU